MESANTRNLSIYIYELHFSIQQICDLKLTKTYRFSCHVIIFGLFYSDDKVVMCAFLFLNLPCYWHSYTKGLYIKNKDHLYSILGKNLSYYPTLWLITSVGAWLVQMIPLFCGHEFKLTNSHVFINTQNLMNALWSKRTSKILNFHLSVNSWLWYT